MKLIAVGTSYRAVRASPPGMHPHSPSPGLERAAPAADEVVINVAYAGVNFAEVAAPGPLPRARVAVHPGTSG